MTKVVFAVLCLCVFFVNRGRSNDYYVDPAGDDSFAGTAAAPWKTINFAISRASSGDKINLKAGATFTENIVIDKGQLGQGNQSLILTSDADNRPKIIPADASKGGILIKESGGILIENIIIQGPGRNKTSKTGITSTAKYTSRENIILRNIDVSEYQRGLYLAGGYKNGIELRMVRVEGCSFHHNLKAGASSWASNVGGLRSILFDRCIFYSNPGDPNASSHTGSGIVLGAVVDGIIQNCVAYDNGADCTTVGGPVGIWTYNSTRVTIQYCEAYNNKAKSADGGGFDIDGGSQDCIIQYCYSHDNAGAGYLLCQYQVARAFTGNIVRYNISQNDGQRRKVYPMGAIHLWSANSSGGLQRTQIYGNTVFRLSVQL